MAFGSLPRRCNGEKAGGMGKSGEAVEARQDEQEHMK
jgi:hypothetical protein